MTKQNSFREGLFKKKEALSKVILFRKGFEKKKKRITADLEKARSIWKEVATRFKWWGSLP